MHRFGRFRAPGLRILAVLSLGACQGDLGPESEVGPPSRLEIRSGSGQTGTVARPLAQPVVARVTDANGRPVPAVPVSFAAPEGGGAFDPSSVTTDEQGEARAVWTLGRRSGPAAATATADGVRAAVSATALADAAARLGFVVVPQTAVAGVAFDPPVAVAIQDQYGNRVPGSSAEIRIGVSPGTVAGIATAVAADGLATFPGLRIDGAGTGYKLLATAPGMAGSESASFPVATGQPAALLVVAGADQDAPVGSTLAVAPTVVVRDARGNGVAGVTVRFSVEAGGGAVALSTVITSASGQASTPWTLGTTTGRNALRVTTPALPDASVEFHADAVPGPVDASRSTVAAVPDIVLRDSTATITVTARDAFGNPIAGALARLSASGQGNSLVQPPATGADGVAVGTFRSSAVGSRTISAEIGGITLAEPAAIMVEHPPVARVVVAPEMAALLVGQTLALTAGALDAAGDPVPGATVVWSSSDPAVASVSTAGLVTAVGAGSATVTATSQGRSGTAQVTVSYGEGTLTDVTYCTMGDVPVKMDVYVPAASKPRPLPVAVHVHGGGWISGEKSKGSRFTQLKPLLLDRGYLVVSLDYRLAPTHKYPAQIQDVKCAIRHLRARAARYGLDPGRIGAWGSSAGGQLVSLLGTADPSAGFDDMGGFQAQSSAVQAVIPIAAITDFTHPEELLDDYRKAFRTWPDPTSAEMIQASPVSHVSATDAPFFLIVPDEDELVMPAQSERMHQLLVDAGVPSSLLRVLHANHALEPTDAPIDPSDPVINSRMADFFDQHLR